MLKEFNDGTVVTPITDFTRPQAEGMLFTQFAEGEEYTVVFEGEGVISNKRNDGVRFMFFETMFDLTGLFTEVKPKTVTQQEARELRQQAEALLVKAQQRESKV